MISSVKKLFSLFNISSIPAALRFWEKGFLFPKTLPLLIKQYIISKESLIISFSVSFFKNFWTKYSIKTVLLKSAATSKLFIFNIFNIINKPVFLTLKSKSVKDVNITEFNILCLVTLSIIFKSLDFIIINIVSKIFKWIFGLSIVLYIKLKNSKIWVLFRIFRILLLSIFSK